MRYEDMEIVYTSDTQPPEDAEIDLDLVEQVRREDMECTE